MDKVRVYELARELGITSPKTIALLKEKLKIRVNRRRARSRKTLPSN